MTPTCAVQMLFIGALLAAGPPPLAAQTFTPLAGSALVDGGGRSTGSNWIDYDGDGDLDLFVANGNQHDQNDFLYRNDGGGAFTRITEGDLVNTAAATIGSTWGDYDNDGDPDAFVITREGQRNYLYRNDGGGAFTRIETGAIGTDRSTANSASWIDLENDGDLDLFVVNFNEPHFLYRNNGDGTFTRVTEGVLVTDVSLSINGLWGDYDGDNDLDLFITNGGQQDNALYRNDGGGAFTRITEGIVVNDGGTTIGGSWGDYNNDGHLDLFTANFLSENNGLYTNNGDGTFTSVTTGAIVTDTDNTAGSAWGDIDHDGDLDLFVGNDGHPNALYRNEGDGTFTRVSTDHLPADAANTFGVSMADYDGDGDLDLFAANRLNQDNLLYVNSGTPNNWIAVRAVGTLSNVSAIGARVHVGATLAGASVWQMREVASQTGYNSQSGLWATFGLGDAAQADEIRITWPSGQVQVLTGVAANEVVTVVEQQTPVGVAPAGRGAPASFRLGPNYPNPFSSATTIPFSLPAPGYATLTIVDALGREVAVLVDGYLPAGRYEVPWQAHGRASGLYGYRLRAGSFTAAGHLVLIR